MKQRSDGLGQARRGVNAFTVWDEKGNRLNSQFGNTSYEEWCKLEAKRLNKGNSINYVAYDDTGCCCVARG